MKKLLLFQCTKCTECLNDLELIKPKDNLNGVYVCPHCGNNSFVIFD